MRINILLCVILLAFSPIFGKIGRVSVWDDFTPEYTPRYWDSCRIGYLDTLIELPREIVKEFIFSEQNPNTDALRGDYYAIGHFSANGHRFAVVSWECLFSFKMWLLNIDSIDKPYPPAILVYDTDSWDPFRDFEFSQSADSIVLYQEWVDSNKQCLIVRWSVSTDDFSCGSVPQPIDSDDDEIEKFKYRRYINNHIDN